MFSLRKTLSPRVLCWLGFAVCPLVTWVCAGIQLGGLVLFGDDIYRWYSLNSSSAIPFLIVALLLCLFWACVIAFAGFATAYFWKDFTSQKLHEEMVAFYAVALTWAPTLFWIRGLVLYLGVPMIFFWCLFNVGLAQGHKFWESSHSRQFFGDFSDMGDSSR